MAYVIIAVCFAISGGIVGRLKGSSFWLWFLISGAIPVFGLMAALAYRFESDELQTPLPPLRPRDEDLRRPLHPLRHRAGLPRDGHRAGTMAAHRPAPGAARAAHRRPLSRRRFRPA